MKHVLICVDVADRYTTTSTLYPIFLTNITGDTIWNCF